MADAERAKAAWVQALTAWYSGYLQAASPLAGMLADEASVPLDPFPRDGHKPCWCLCGTAHPQDNGVCDMEAVVTRPVASTAAGTVDLHVCAPCWAASGAAGMTGA